MTKVFIAKTNKDVKTPVTATKFSSGADVYAYIPEESCVSLHPGQTHMFPTGLFMQPEEGYDIKLFPRSGLAAKLKITLTNAVGVIDRDYDKEVKVLLHNLSNNHVTICHDERIAQMLVQRVNPISFIDCEVLPEIDSNRKDGFGSTGK